MYVRMLHIYVQNRNFYTRISYVLNEKNKEKGAICQMVHFVSQYCIDLITLVNAKLSIFHVTPFYSK